MNGPENDLILALDGKNCPTFGKALEDNKHILEDVATKYQTFLDHLTTMFAA